AESTLGDLCRKSPWREISVVVLAPNHDYSYIRFSKCSTRTDRWWSCWHSLRRAEHSPKRSAFYFILPRRHHSDHPCYDRLFHDSLLAAIRTQRGFDSSRSETIRSWSSGCNGVLTCCVRPMVVRKKSSAGADCRYRICFRRYVGDVV